MSVEQAVATESETSAKPADPMLVALRDDMDLVDRRIMALTWDYVHVGFSAGEYTERLGSILREERDLVSIKIALYKKRMGLPIYDATREEQKVRKLAGEYGFKVEDVRAFYTPIFEHSRKIQVRIVKSD